jgi:hypothetical protein
VTKNATDDHVNPVGFKQAIQTRFDDRESFHEKVYHLFHLTGFAVQRVERHLERGIDRICDDRPDLMSLGD